MKIRNFTVGTKLFAAFGTMLALLLGSIAIRAGSVRYSARQLDTVLHNHNKKLEAGSQVELVTTEMQGAQRGLMWSHSVQDSAASVQYKKLYEDSGARIDGLILELRPLLASDAEWSAIAQIEGNRAAWEPRFQKLLHRCESGSRSRTGHAIAEFDVSGAQTVIGGRRGFLPVRKVTISITRPGARRTHDV
jgi:hypothetical protein